jgi:hypothetical protein
MLLSLPRIVMKTAVVAGLTFGVVLPVTVFSAEPAFANNGNGNGGGKSNGNGGGNSNAGSSRGNSGNNGSSGNNGNSGNSNAGGNGNGNGNSAIARELVGLSAADASPSAMANASANSMSGKLFTYQQARRHLVQRVTEQNAAYEAYVRLSAMNEAQAAAAYPSGNHAHALNEAAHAYNALQAQAEAAQSISDASLMSISGGQALSSAAMTELHRMLGL